MWEHTDILHIVLSFTQLSQPPAHLGERNMDFNGTWQVYAQENYEEFLKAMGEQNSQGAVGGLACKVKSFFGVTTVHKLTPTHFLHQNSQQM